MTKPTRDETFEFKWALSYEPEKVDMSFILRLVEAYLTQEEELRNLEIGFTGKVEQIGNWAAKVQALEAENQALKDKFDWFKNEREKDSRVIDRLLEEKQKLEAYIAENEGYQP